MTSGARLPELAMASMGGLAVAAGSSLLTSLIEGIEAHKRVEQNQLYFYFEARRRLSH